MREPFREHFKRDFSASGYPVQQPAVVEATTPEQNVLIFALIVGSLVGLTALGVYALTH